MNPPNTTPLNEELDSIFDNFEKDYQASSGSMAFQKSAVSAKQELTNLIQTLENKAVENARSKDPFKCEFGHKVYSHNTADGWCCACDADIAFLNRQLEKGSE